MADYIILGIGNPGLRYRASRHNVGWWVVDELAGRHGIAVRKRRHHGVLGEGLIDGVSALLVKPQTFVNRSGDCARAVVDFYKLPVDRLVVISDDCNLPPGRLRVRRSGSAGGHNGLKSVEHSLGSRAYPRIRIGIGQPPPGGELVAHVLGRPRGQELTEIRAAVSRAADAISVLLADGVETAMNQFNG